MGEIRTLFAAEVSKIWPSLHCTVSVSLHLWPLCFASVISLFWAIALACIITRTQNGNCINSCDAAIKCLRGCWGTQLLLRSETRYFPANTIIADSKERANGLMVITTGQASSLHVPHCDADDNFVTGLDLICKIKVSLSSRLVLLIQYIHQE